MNKITTIFKYCLFTVLIIITYFYVSTDEYNTLYKEPWVQQDVAIHELPLSHVELPEENYVKVPAKVTAYAPLDNKSGICAEGNPHITATGKHPSRGIAAVDPKKIPYGTQIHVPGYGDVVAGDTGGALRSYNGIQVEIFMDSYEEAIKWGVQYIDVTIIK